MSQHLSRTPASKKLALWSTLVLAVALTLVFATSALAVSTIYVRPAGSDTQCNGTVDADYSAGVAPNCAFQTVQRGISQAVDGGTVNVAAGTYNENQITIDKALTLQGAGAVTTIIDGGAAIGLPGTGLVRITAGGNVSFSGFTVRNAGTDAGGVRVAIYASSPTTGVTYTISNNGISGSGNPEDAEDYGFYTNGGLESLVFAHNTITQTGANAILIEKHPGATDVSYNTFDRGVANGSNDAYFNMNYGGAAVTTLQKVSHNTVDMGNDAGPYDYAHRGFAMTFAGDFTSAGVPGGFTNVQVADNIITNLKSYRRGIGTWNNAPGAGTSGDIAGLVIERNTIQSTGATRSIGVGLLGLSTGTIVRDNTINNVDIVFQGRAWNGHIATGALVNHNNFTNSTTGLSWQGPALLNAEGNWWGSACGPSVVGPGNGVPVSTNVDYDPWWARAGGPGWSARAPAVRSSLRAAPRRWRHRQC